MNLPDRIRTDRVIPVARGLDGDSAPRLAGAIEAGGIGSLEITVEGEGGLAAISAVASGDILIGAGTVTTVDIADRALAAGARFVVAPHFDAGLVAWGHRNAVPVIPGALTPTEVATAWSESPAAVKLFPAHLGGPAYVRSLLAPYPGLTLIPTGGVSVENIGEYLAAGAAAVGVGGWLTGGSDYREISRRAALLAEAVDAGSAG